MKKLLVLVVVSLLFSAGASAQEATAKKTFPPRKAYINLSYVHQSLTVPGSEMGKLTTDYGAAFTLGRTYYLHRKPIGRVLYFGLDATWLDLNYGHYSKTSEVEDYMESYTEKMELHQAEIGMQIGPSVTLLPVSRLKTHLYFRFQPSFAAIYADETFGYNYASCFVTGLSVSYGVIGVGIERRWGECKYRDFDNFGNNDESYGSGDSTTSTDKWKTSGYRVYLNFRF